MARALCLACGGLADARGRCCHTTSAVITSLGESQGAQLFLPPQPRVQAPETPLLGLSALCPCRGPSHSQSKHRETVGSTSFRSPSSLGRVSQEGRGAVLAL